MKRVSALRVQGAYYVVSGLAPLVAYRPFTAVTGPKADDWLVKTFGLLVAGFGASLLRWPSRQVAGPAAAVAGAIGIAETWYVLRGRIRPVYLTDAVVEAILVAALARASDGRSRGTRPRPWRRAAEARG